MVDCAEFLDSYSDFRDGLLPAERGEGFEAHVQSCDSCARYNRVVGGGVQVFQSLPALTPSPDFEARLLHRLHLLDNAAGRHGSGASLAVTLMICMALGIGAWLPALRAAEGETVRLPAIVAHAPYHDLTPVLMSTRVSPIAAGLDRPQLVYSRVAPGLNPSQPVYSRIAPGLNRSQPAYYGQGLLLEQSAAFTALAYRPVSVYYRPR